MPSENRIYLPRRLNQASIEELYQTLNKAFPIPDVCIDFSTIDYVFPMAVLVTGGFLRNWNRNRRLNGLSARIDGLETPKDSLSYLKHLGFFDFIGIQDKGNRIGQARGSNTYVPIKAISRPNGYSNDSADLKMGTNLLYQEASKIATVLAGCDENSESHKITKYIVREVLRNVFEHSGKGECFVCAQRWWDGSAQIAIMDEGIGIRRSLGATIDLPDDETALALSIQPGISRISGMDENPFDNSGYGLYVLSQLGSSFGWFSLGSGNRTMVFKENRARYLKVPFPGTFVGVHLSSTPKSVIGTIHDIVESGEVTAKAHGRKSSPSKMSSSLLL